MNYKKILNEIQERQLKTFCLMPDFRDKKHIELLPRKHRGLYWIWTNISFKDLQTIPVKDGSKEVPIAQLVSQRQNLNYINKISKDGFKIVYNGIGGYNKEPANFGLRERIIQELSCNDHRTGTLNLLNGQSEFKGESYWAISFFDFDDKRNKSIVDSLIYKNNPYLDHAKTLEIAWRLEFGIPILCRH